MNRNLAQTADTFSCYTNNPGFYFLKEQPPNISVDVAYTKIYEAKNMDKMHVSEQSSLCYDQKLGWCMTKAAPHEHEREGNKGRGQEEQL